jgi:signal transduction histidine kinase
MIPKFKIEINIKTKLALQFMAIVSVILFIFAFIIYFFTYKTHEDKFRLNLLNRAKYTAIVINKSHIIDKVLLDKIFSTTYTAQYQEILICDSNLKILYAFNRDQITRELIEYEFANDEDGYFSTSFKDGFSTKFHFNNQVAMLILMAHDNNRTGYLKELTRFLFWGILTTMLITTIMAYLFSKQALRPISKIIKEVTLINANNLNIRLDEGDGKDELEQLSSTFNTMLDGLEHSFINQAEFVANASHELKTPLSIMIAESDYLLSKPQNNDDYKKHILKNIEYVKQFNEHLNNLLELARINQLTGIEKRRVRLDDIVYDAIKLVKDKYPDRRIVTKIELPEDDSGLFIDANHSLMVLAIKNLLENACKFSSDEINVNLETKSNLCLTISDKGIGIPAAELSQINKPYRRAGNARYISGFGIGLSLVNRIIDAHNFSIQINSILNNSTNFTIRF